MVTDWKSGAFSSSEGLAVVLSVCEQLLSCAVSVWPSPCDVTGLFVCWSTCFVMLTGLSVWESTCSVVSSCAGVGGGTTVVCWSVESGDAGVTNEILPLIEVRLVKRFSACWFLVNLWDAKWGIYFWSNEKVNSEGIIIWPNLMIISYV